MLRVRYVRTQLRWALRFAPRRKLKNKLASLAYFLIYLYIGKIYKKKRYIFLSTYRGGGGVDKK